MVQQVRRSEYIDQGDGSTSAYARNAALSSLTKQRSAQVLYWRFFLNAALMLIDGAVYMASLTIILLVCHEFNDPASFRFDFHLNIVLYITACAVIWVICAFVTGVYHRHVLGDGYELNLLLIKASCVCILAVSAFNYLFGFMFSLPSILTQQVIVLVVIMLERMVARHILTKERRKGKYSYPTVLVGSPEGIVETLRFLSSKSQVNYRPVAVCPIHLNATVRAESSEDGFAQLRAHIADVAGSELPLLVYGDDFAEQVVNMGAETVMITDSMHRFSDEFNAFVLKMETLDLEVALTTSAADVAGHSTRMRIVEGRSILTIGLPQYTPAVRIGKRCFDLVVSSVAIVLSSIVTIPVAIAIKATDGGPVFYRQTRIGRNGRPFKMIKFRSMVVDADAQKAQLAKETGQEGRFIFKMKDDPRITPVGKFIRRFSIDELPQFLNVFVGDMSVVGPRPPLPEEYFRYSVLYATRMLVKPGITGPWQVSGRSDLSEKESEALDVSYVQHWSVLGDLVIMLKTVGAVLGHKGAY